MSSGGDSVTSGGVLRRLFSPWLSPPVLWIAALTLIVTFVNVTSEQIEAARRGAELAFWKPFLWEMSSYVLIVVLAPLIGVAQRRWPVSLAKPLPNLLLHAALTVPYSAIHVAGMVAIRKVGYAAAVHAGYDFSNGALPLELIYEWRKDVLTYALNFFIFALLNWRALKAAQPAQAAAPDPKRLELRTGASTVFLDPKEILFLEAAGNYVEVHTAARMHLVRGALSGFEQRLAPYGFVRVHRARIVNRARIRAIEATASGDAALTLDDGRVLAASRRFRAALEGSASTGAQV